MKLAISLIKSIFHISYYLFVIFYFILCSYELVCQKNLDIFITCHFEKQIKMY